MEGQHYEDGGVEDRLVCYGDVWIKEEEEDDDDAVFGSPSSAGGRGEKYVDNTEYLRREIKVSGRMILVDDRTPKPPDASEASDTAAVPQPIIAEDSGESGGSLHPRTLTRTIINKPGWHIKYIKGVVELLKVMQDVVQGESGACSGRSTLMNDRSPKNAREWCIASRY